MITSLISTRGNGIESKIYILYFDTCSYVLTNHVPNEAIGLIDSLMYADFIEANGDVANEKEAFRKYTKHLNIAACKRIYVPININKNHWMLGLVKIDMGVSENNYQYHQHDHYGKPKASIVKTIFNALFDTLTPTTPFFLNRWTSKDAKAISFILEVVIPLNSFITEQ
jgi:Ulp1 family protease